MTYAAKLAVATLQRAASMDTKNTLIVRRPVCYTCGEAYAGASETACPFCGSTWLSKVTAQNTIGAD